MNVVKEGTKDLFRQRFCLTVLVKRRFILKFFIAILLFVVVYGVMAYYKWEVERNSRQVIVTVNFLLPMKQKAFDSKISVTPELPNARVTYKVNWLSPTTVKICLEQKGFPQGQLLSLKINRAPTKIPLINKSVNRKVRLKVPLKMLTDKKQTKISSRGPVLLKFNTPVRPAAITKFISLPVPGSLKPARILWQGKSYVDYSTWRYFPHEPLKNDTSYRITVKAGIPSAGGSTLQESEEILFRTVRPLRVLGVSPAEGAIDVKLYCNIEARLDQHLKTGHIKVNDPRGKIEIPGNTQIAGDKIIFRPERAFLPGKSYRVKISAESVNGELLTSHKYNFTTVDLGDKYWVDVKLGKIHTVKVFKGTKLVRHMLASGGKTDSPTPMGYFYTKDRGQSFWSPRFGEGATYWVRLIGQILVHSVPKDHNWNTKKDEHGKLGLPASHGCIRLDEIDARWFYENIPMGTMVIIHN